MSQSQKVELRLEVVVLPVADPDRTKAFYQRLGWREDADFKVSDSFRIIQFTPPGSPTSIHFGTGVTQKAPGTGPEMYLVVTNIEAARAALIELGADVSPIWHNSPKFERLPGRDPEGRTYASMATFTDPDGNRYLLQEITSRLPGRV